MISISNELVLIVISSVSPAKDAFFLDGAVGFFWGIQFGKAAVAEPTALLRAGSFTCWMFLRISLE